MIYRFYFLIKCTDHLLAGLYFFQFQRKKFEIFYLFIIVMNSKKKGDDCHFTISGEEG